MIAPGERLGNSTRVKRCLVAVILAAGGCDRVFGLVRETTTQLCGPYGTPEPVLFSGPLLAAGVHDFSVDATGQIGMAWANIGSGSTAPWRGPHAIELDANGVWVQDLAHDQPVLDSLDGGHIQADGLAIGWTDVPRGATLREYTFSTVANRWAPGVDQIESALTTSAHVGNVIVSDDGILRHLVEILIPDRAPFENTVQIYERLATMPWKLTAQANPFRLDETLNVTGAVLTKAHDRIVYTGMVGDEMEARIFAGKRVRDQFELGGELEIMDVDSPVGFSEPWINADCTTLYFRRDEVTWQTTRMDP